MNSDWLDTPPRRPDAEAEAAAQARQACLTKPPGALGRLEALAIRMAALQGRERPTAARVRIVVFAGDHGVVEEGVSAFPQAVTTAMIHNFAAGGAAISVLARTQGAALEVVDVGAAADPGPLSGVVSRRAGAGTANFCRGAAMTPEQLDTALEAGREAVARALAAGCDLFIGGEMGIGNTTAATALACALLGRPPQALAGPGTGLDAAGVAHKVQVVARALERHGPLAESPLEALRRLGGFELAALTGAYLACAQHGLPVLVDGFIASAAALAAVRHAPEAAPWLLLAHASAEPGHRHLVEALGGAPILDLGMRLGEGSGAATALAVLRLALELHAGMATFEEAGIGG